MAFIRSTEPFQEPPQHRSHWLLAVGIAALLVFFVPLLVIIAMGQNSPPARAEATGSPATLPPPQRMPPLPPAGVPWPPPPGAPVPPVCTLEYKVGADGGTTWTAMLTLSGKLAVSAPAPAHGARPQELTVPAAVEVIGLHAALARDHGLRAVLTSSSGHFDCLVGPEA